MNSEQCLIGNDPGKLSEEPNNLTYADLLQNTKNISDDEIKHMIGISPYQGTTH